MILPGRLGLTTLGDVLGSVLRQGVTGVVVLVEDGGATVGTTHRVHLVGGRVADVESRAPTTLLGTLLRVVGAKEKATDIPLARRERLERLFLLGDARLSFRACQVRDGGGSAPLAPGDYLRGRPRARDREVPGRGPPARRLDPVRARALTTLGLPQDAATTDVREAFRRLARQMHPDRHLRATTAEREAMLRRFSEVTAAYHALA